MFGAESNAWSCGDAWIRPSRNVRPGHGRGVMPMLYATRGLPGSGKTWYATAWVAEDPARRARVNRDDLRAMIHGGRHIPGGTEKQIIAVRDATILALLRQHIDVICDDTNLNPRVMRDLAGLARRAGASFEVIDLTGVPLGTCIDRDARRQAPVGESVIRGMRARFLKDHEPLPAAAGASGSSPQDGWQGDPR